MSLAAAATDRRWRRALGVGLALVVGSLVPSPLERHEAFDRYGPDKWLHCLGHGVFAVTVADAVAATGQDRGRAALVGLCLSTGLGVAVGRLQRYVPGRVPELADLTAGALGSLAGVGWWYRTGDRS